MTTARSDTLRISNATDVPHNESWRVAGPDISYEQQTETVVGFHQTSMCVCACERKISGVEKNTGSRGYIKAFLIDRERA